MSALSEDEAGAFTHTKYPRFSERVYIQHGWNLFYVGIWSLACIYPLVAGNRYAWWFGLHQYFFDWGYFMDIDWVFRGGAMGQAQTFIVSGGLICAALSVGENFDVSATEIGPCENRP